MFELKNIFFKYNKMNDWLIKDFNLTINKNEIIGLMGKSGIGKTTIALLMSGYLKPQKGEVLFGNKKVPQKGYCPIQLIHQHPEKAVNPAWKVKKIIKEIKGFNPDKQLTDKLMIDEILLNRYPHELSIGELQRFAVLRILNEKTKLIIADEITGMLDAITQAKIWRAIIDFIDKNNSSLFIISHDIKLLNKICNRIITI